jgi:hypothetical protein
MADITLSVDGVNDAGNHRFVSLNAALAHGLANHADLSAATGFDGRLRFPVSIGTEENLNSLISSFTGTDIDRYIDIYGVGNGLATGVWNTGRFRIVRTVGYQAPMAINVPYTRVTGIQIASLYTGTTGYSALAASVPGVVVDRCILRCDTGNTGFSGAARCSAAGAHLTLRNCVIYGKGYNSGVSTLTSTTMVLENCLIYMPNATQGAVNRAGGTIVVTNCYCASPAAVLRGTGASLTQTKVATSDDSSADATLRNIAAAVGSGACFTDLTVDSEDFTITGASALRDVANTLAGFTHDVTGAQRTGVWDIGPFEYALTSQFARPTSDIADGNWKRWTGNPLTEQDNVGIYTALDETTPDGAEVARSGAQPVNDTLTFGLSAVNPPAAGPVVMRFKVRRVP